ncbi:MAG: NADP-dependent malic enzyme [Zetaproteobacteria bacterium]|nr:NADP-dependent malic enzyme [Pseudobdellovibrionaceae bacterium]
MIDYEKDSLDYHQNTPKGKIGIKLTKPLNSQEDLSLAYSPGVAGPCRKISENIDKSFQYTNRSNLVAVVSSGSAVLGLGNIGAYASKPVMEGKAMLFKKFSDIDVFDLEVDSLNVEHFISVVSSLEPTFGGINLEDIKAPDCFYIEEELRKKMSIPVFHDDQHGTAIIMAAAFLNALELTNRKITSLKVVINGAGAAAIACANILLELGLRLDQIFLCDSKGVVSTNRKDLNTYKQKFARQTSFEALKDVIEGADAFIGVSVADVLSPEMLKSMNNNPIVFALANPNPEIDPDLAKRTRSDVIIATGRSDYANQVNNVLGFPYIFRGALDVRATCINEEMKLAAVKAIADLAKDDVPDEVLSIYKDNKTFIFGKDYLIPKPVDQRVLLKVAPAVAKAAMDSGVARLKIDIDNYIESIEKLLGPLRQTIRSLRKETKKNNKKNTRPKIVITNGNNIRVLKAAKQVSKHGEVDILILGNKDKMKLSAQNVGLSNIDHLQIIDTRTVEIKEEYQKSFKENIDTTNLSELEVINRMRDENTYASLMLKLKEVDGVVSGVGIPYAQAVRPILHHIARGEKSTLAGVYILVINGKMMFFSDCTMNINPDTDKLVEIAESTIKVAKQYTKDQLRLAMLSFASFSSNSHEDCKKVSRATKILQNKKLGIEIVGEIQADAAINQQLRKEEFPDCKLTGNANILIFPDLSSANISYKLLSNIAETAVAGPILAGLKNPANVLQRWASVDEITNMIYMSAHQASKSN